MFLYRLFLYRLCLLFYEMLCSFKHSNKFFLPALFTAPLKTRIRIDFASQEGDLKPKIYLKKTLEGICSGSYIFLYLFRK